MPRYLHANKHLFYYYSLFLLNYSWQKSQESGHFSVKADLTAMFVIFSVPAICCFTECVCPSFVSSQRCPFIYSMVKSIVTCSHSKVGMGDLSPWTPYRLLKLSLRQIFIFENQSFTVYLSGSEMVEKPWGHQRLHLYYHVDSKTVSGHLILSHVYVQNMYNCNTL